MKRSGRRYRTGRADAHYDTLVIGSGIGGLTTAALLARLGKKVAVLEQHYTAGGFTHSYERNGFEWDVGVHYIGEVHKPYAALRRLFDVIADGNIRWATMDKVYDRIIIAGKTYDFPQGRDAFKAELKKHFPAEALAIDRYMAIVYKVARSAERFFAGQGMPPALARAYLKLRPYLVPKECFMTTREVLERLTQHQELIAVLTGQWGDYGMVPAESSFLMHATVVKHFMDGGNYPVGGSWTMAEHIVPVIRRAGGEVFTYARVREIIVDADRACGVIMENGDRLHADNVVSAAGARITFEKLLPAVARQKHGYDKKMQKLRPSSSHLCLYAGFRGSAAELGLPRTNLWIYPGVDHEANCQRFNADSSSEFPMLYVSFPSAKDPEWNSHYPGKSTVEVLTMGPYEWFEKWSGSTWNQRGEDYEAFKQQFTDRLLEALYQQMPQLRGALEYCELSTPLSTEWFQLNDRGEIYGLEHDVQRFQQGCLHPVTAVKGLYLTGQDVCSAGVGGAMMGGMLTTMAMQGAQAWKVYRLLRNWKPEMATALLAAEQA